MEIIAIPIIGMHMFMIGVVIMIVSLLITCSVIYTIRKIFNIKTIHDDLPISWLIIFLVIGIGVSELFKISGIFTPFL